MQKHCFLTLFQSLLTQGQSWGCLIVSEIMQKQPNLMEPANFGADLVLLLYKFSNRTLAVAQDSPSTHLGQIGFTEISHASFSHLKQHLSKHAFSSEEEKRGRWEYNDKRVWVYLSGCTRMLSTTSSNCSLWSHTHTKWRTVAGITPDTEETQKREEKKREKKRGCQFFCYPGLLTDRSLGMCETLSIKLHLNLKSDWLKKSF